MTELSAAARAAVLKALMDRIKKAYDEARAEADDQLRKAYTSLSASRMDVVLPGVGKVAKMTLSVPDASVALDQPKLLAWVKRHAPEQVRKRIETTEFVDAAYVKSLLARLQFDDDADVLSLGGDPDEAGTGDVVTWARIVPSGRGSTTLTFETGARSLIEESWRRGDLLPQLMLEEAPKEETHAQPDGD